MIKKQRNSKLDALQNLAGDEAPILKTNIPTGHPELDFYISRGLFEDEHGRSLEYDEEKIYGIPSGILAMFFGGEAGGKSSLAYRVCGNAQRMGRIPFWIDAENSFSEQLAKINGLDPSRDAMIIQKLFDPSNPEKVFDAETILDRMMEACKEGAGVVVLDSVAGLIPKYVMDNPAEKDTMAILARVLGKTLGKLAGYAAANDVLIIFINQLRVNPSQTWGNPEGTTGGNALMHFCSLILKINKLTSKDTYHYIEDDDGNETLIAGTSNVWLNKNRFAVPHKEGIRIPIYYKYYFPEIEEIIFEYGRKSKAIRVRSGIYSWDGNRVEGRSNFIKTIRDAGKLTALVADIRVASEENGVPLPPEIINYEKHAIFDKENKVKRGEEPADYDPKVRPSKKKSKDKPPALPVDVEL